MVQKINAGNQLPHCVIPHVSSRVEIMIKYFLCFQGEKARVEELLKAGATPNTRDNAGWTPLVNTIFRTFIGSLKKRM